MPKIDIQEIDEIMERGTIVNVLPTKELFKEKLLSGEKLRFYIGFDATAPTLHLSHAKNIMLLEKFRKLGHEAILLFGDFTARIGDPTGMHDSARKQLTREDVLNNVATWKKLIKPLMNFEDTNNPPQIKYNHDWLSPLTMEDVVKLSTNFTVQQMLERDMFQKRITENKPIYLHEFLYPLMQGYDSVAMDVDVEICGTDQTFNALAGRTLQKRLHNKEKFVVAVTLMENPKTGELMSKSRGTGVFLDASINDMFGQIMAQADEMIEILYINSTFLSKSEIADIISTHNPRDAKLKLALEITKMYHGESEAQKAQEYWISTFSKKEIPDEMPNFKPTSYDVLSVLVDSGLVTSKGEARRAVEQGGVKINGEVIKDTKVELKSGDILQKGKIHFLKVE
jgi:tyrosyl-tRNA synthetase